MLPFLYLFNLIFNVKFYLIISKYVFGTVVMAGENKTLKVVQFFIVKVSSNLLCVI